MNKLLKILGALCVVAALVAIALWIAARILQPQEKAKAFFVRALQEALHRPVEVREFRVRLLPLLFKRLEIPSAHLSIDGAAVTLSGSVDPFPSETPLFDLQVSLPVSGTPLTAEFVGSLQPPSTLLISKLKAVFSVLEAELYGKVSGLNTMDPAMNLHLETNVFSPSEVPPLRRAIPSLAALELLGPVSVKADLSGTARALRGSGVIRLGQGLSGRGPTVPLTIRGAASNPSLRLETRNLGKDVVQRWLQKSLQGIGIVPVEGIFK